MSGHQNWFGLAFDGCGVLSAETSFDHPIVVEATARAVANVSIVCRIGLPSRMHRKCICSDRVADERTSFSVECSD
jgi:hypothetical protein